MALLGTQFQVSSVGQGFRTAPEVLSAGFGQKSAGAFVLAFGSPCAIALLSATTVSCAWAPGT